MRKAFGYGMLSCIPIVIAEYIIFNFLNLNQTSVVGSIMTAFFGAALPEEGFKLLALWLILRNNRYFDEHIDGIVYSVCVGLGFATVENVGYVLGSGEMGVAISRAFLAVPCHYACAVLMGYYYSVYHFVDHSDRAKWSILLVPIIAHGIYDSIAFQSSVFSDHPEYCAIFMIVLCIFCVKLHQFSKKQIDKQIAKDQSSKKVDWEENQA